MESEVEKILDVIDGIMDISNFVYDQSLLLTTSSRTIIHPRKNNDEWRDMIAKIDKELRDKGLIREDETIKVNFDYTGKMRSIEKILDIYEKPGEFDKKYEVDDCEVYIKKIDHVVITHESVSLIISQADWKNYKRTKLMDRMLDER